MEEDSIEKGGTDMHIDTAGTYTLQYTATDSCGNETIEERTVEVIELHTTLFTDGTFIINEKSTDRDANIALHGAVTNEYDPLDATHPYNFGTEANRPWNGQASNVLAVEIGSPIAPTNTRNWFGHFTNCNDYDFTGLDMGQCVSTTDMFIYCTALTSMDISAWDTKNVTSMEGMFSYCENLKTANLSGIDAKKVTSMKSLFLDAQSLESVDFTGIQTRDLESIFEMFYSCSALTSIDLSDLDFSRLQNMEYAFYNCAVVQTIILPTTKTVSLTNMNSAFDSCYVLGSLDASNFDTTNVTNMSSLFSNCRALTELDISSFSSASLQNINYMFKSCISLVTIYATNAFRGETVSSRSNTFDGCTRLVGGAGTTYNTTRKGGYFAHIDNPPDELGFFTARA